MTYILLALALISFISCYGVMRRTIWMWYLGWLYLYGVAGYFSYPFHLYTRVIVDEARAFYATFWMLGGLLLWLCALRWWIKMRPKFTAKY